MRTGLTVMFMALTGDGGSAGSRGLSERPKPAAAGTRRGSAQPDGHRRPELALSRPWPCPSAEPYDHEGNDGLRQFKPGDCSWRSKTRKEPGLVN
jgi:hypothetical protein